MQLLNKFDSTKVEQFLINENKFITNLFSIAAIPERKDSLYDEDESKEGTSSGFNKQSGKTSRAKSLEELQQRLEAITTKRKLSYKEKLTKKSLKNRMKKKSKHDERNAKQKLVRAAKLTTKAEVKVEEQNENEHKETKPVFNSEDKMVFSKFDFANLGKTRVKKQENDPKKLLKKLNDQENKLKTLQQSGETAQVSEIKEKTAWKNALAKAQGVKVKDDPTLLKKSVKKREQKQRTSKKKWDKRLENVQKAKEEKQTKRKENIDKRKKQKKNKKLKAASKRGKIIPGF